MKHKRERQLKGINRVRKRLADGTVETYYYHRASGTRLPSPYGGAEFLGVYLEAEKGRAASAENLDAIIGEYLRSPKFARKAARTQKEYRRLTGIVAQEFGSMPLKALESPKARGAFIDYQEQIAAEGKLREADNRLTMLSTIFSYAMDKGRISRNPLFGFERLYSSKRSEIIWTENDVERFMDAAEVELQRVMILALHTGQRYGDLIRMTWSDYDGTCISLRQSKGSVPVSITCTTALKRMLDEAPRTSTTILTRADGRPWTTENDDKALSKAWRARMEAAGFYSKPMKEMTKAEKGTCLHLHDLRGTAVTLLAEAGASVPQIAAITGHTLDSASRILARYMSMTPALAKAAMVLFENAEGTQFANRLQTKTAS